MRKAIKSTHTKAEEKQALINLVKGIRSIPFTVYGKLTQ